METNKLQWKRIAEGEALPCDSFTMKEDGTIPSVISVAGVRIGQDSYYLPIEELRTLPKEESEDERIRKELIGYFTGWSDKRLFRGFKAEQMLAWLEKQGAHKKFRDSIQIGDNVTRNKDGVLINLSRLKRMAKKDEKQGEQKPVDKVEPTFKVGDWVVYCNDDVDLITGIEENGYSVNNSGYIPFICASDMRPWTLEDAKDGDVLVHSSSMFGDFIFIYNNTSILQAYCYYSSERDRFIIEDRGHHCHWNMQEVKPATKEQRDTLEKAMADAGYTFDFEKKKLKKIEQKSLVPKFRVGDKVKHGYLTYTVDSILEDSYKMTAYGEEGHKGCTEYLTIGHEDGYELVEQKPTEWSEEDERYLNSIINRTVAFGDSSIHGLIKDDINWLKSIKDRVCCEADYITSLLPSDEQMEYLAAAYEENESAVLESLYQKLKKLKG